MTSRLREIVEREIKEGRDYGDLIMEVLVKSAAKGNIKAISMLMDRVDGKVAQQVFVQDGLAAAVELLRERQRSRDVGGPAGDVPG